MDVIFRAFICFFLCKSGYSACGETELKKTYQEFKYFATKSENCTWTFSPPDNQTDFALVIKLSATSYNFKDYIYFPDGELLPRKDIRRGTNDACRKYVFSQDQVGSCNSDLIRQYCTHQISVVKNPVQMSLDIYSKLYIEVSYAFLRCSERNFGNEDEKPKSENKSMLIGIIMLTVILVFMCMVSIYLFRRKRNFTATYAQASRTDSFHSKKNMESDIMSSCHSSSMRSTAPTLPQRSATANPYAVATDFNTYEELNTYAKDPKLDTNNDIKGNSDDLTRTSPYVNHEDVPNVLYHSVLNTRE